MTDREAELEARRQPPADLAGAETIAWLDLLHAGYMPSEANKIIRVVGPLLQALEQRWRTEFQLRVRDAARHQDRELGR